MGLVSLFMRLLGSLLVTNLKWREAISGSGSVGGALEDLILLVISSNASWYFIRLIGFPTIFRVILLEKTIIPAYRKRLWRYLYFFL